MAQFGFRGINLALILVFLSVIANELPAKAGSSTHRSTTYSVFDPMTIVVSLETQRLQVYRGGQLISSSRVSTGRSGYRTPAGVFSILQKRRWHRSNIYSNAPMPFMQRLTWSGIALHAGHVPNYPASHGCIRLPPKFARELFSSSKVGSHVIVTRNETEPVAVEHAALLQPRPLRLITMDEREALLTWMGPDEAPKRWIPIPEKAPHSSPEMISSADDQYENAVQQLSAHVEEALSPRDDALTLADTEHDLEQLNWYSKRSPEPLRILITLREDRERIRDMQRMLQTLGHDPGPIDGYNGRETRAAIKAFAEANDLQAGDGVSDALADALYAAAKEEPAPNGHIYVRQGFRRLFDAPIKIADPEKPLGTHLTFLSSFEPWDESVRWLAVTTGGEQGESVSAALDRIEIPLSIRDRLEKLLTPGSSMIISDSGLSETGEETDFIVLNN